MRTTCTWRLSPSAIRCVTLSGFALAGAIGSGCFSFSGKCPGYHYEIEPFQMNFAANGPKVVDELHLVLTTDFETYRIAEHIGVGQCAFIDIGGSAASLARSLASALAQNVAIHSTRLERAPSSDGLTLAPRFVVARNELTALTTGKSTIAIEWEAIDSRGEVVWLGRSSGSAQGSAGTVFDRMNDVTKQALRAAYIRSHKDLVENLGGQRME